MNAKTPPVIKVTKAWKLFKIIDANREINKSHLKKLIAAIEKRNLLHLFPIIVNQQMQVIEGQHRLRAAEHLQHAIYYIIDNEVTSTDIAIVNNNRKAWSAKDYISFYAKSGLPDYKHLDKLIKNYPCITTMCAIRLVHAEKINYFSGGGYHSQWMRNGETKAPNHALAMKIAELCRTLHKRYDYTFQPAFMLGMKNAIMSCMHGTDTAIEKIDGKRHCLPKVIEKGETCLSIFKTILE